MIDIGYLFLHRSFLKHSLDTLPFRCCQSIVDGKVQVKSQVEIDHFEPDAIVLSDGSRVEADVVVLAYVHVTSLL